MQKPTIVMILESPEEAVMLRGILERGGCHAVCVGVIDPDRALQIVRDAGARLILLDFHLTGSRSIDLLEALKSDAVLRDIPVLMLIETSYVGDGAQYLTAEPQPDGYLLKPIHADVLLDKVCGCLPAACCDT